MKNISLILNAVLLVAVAVLFYLHFSAGAPADVSAAGITGDVLPIFEIIIPPLKGHGYDIYRDLGSKNVLIYSRIENDDLNPDRFYEYFAKNIGLRADSL